MIRIGSDMLMNSFRIHLAYAAGRFKSGSARTENGGETASVFRPWNCLASLSVLNHHRASFYPRFSPQGVNRHCGVNPKNETACRSARYASMSTPGRNVRPGFAHPKTHPIRDCYALSSAIRVASLIENAMSCGCTLCPRTRKSGVRVTPGAPEKSIVSSRAQSQGWPLYFSALRAGGNSVSYARAACTAVVLISKSFQSIA